MYPFYDSSSPKYRYKQGVVEDVLTIKQRNQSSVEEFLEAKSVLRVPNIFDVREIVENRFFFELLIQFSASVPRMPYLSS